MENTNSIGQFGLPIVVRFKDGHVMKCFTKDFYPNKDNFHITSEDGVTHILKISELKAIFFVKSLKGDKYRRDKNRFSVTSKVAGKKVGIKFKDGEKLVGTALNYNTKNKGFFVTPADEESNNEKVFIISNAVEKIVFVP